MAIVGYQSYHDDDPVDHGAHIVARWWLMGGSSAVVECRVALMLIVMDRLEKRNMWKSV